MIGFAQIGKNKLTDDFIKNLENQFKTKRDVKVTVLASARKSKQDVKEYEKQILEKLGKKYSARTIGFTIMLKKWRHDVRE